MYLLLLHRQRVGVTHISAESSLRDELSSELIHQFSEYLK